MPRRGASSAAGGPDWIQPCMLPPLIVQADIRLRLALDERSVQYQIEVSDPVTKELLAMRSRPKHPLGTREGALVEAFTWLRDAIEVLVDPDPF